MTASDQSIQPPEESIQVLLVEDNAADRLLVRTQLRQDGSEGEYHFESVETLAAALEALDQGPYDVILLDLSLPDSAGLDTFSVVYAHSPSTPIIVMSGLDDERVAATAVHAGAQDYLVKGQVDQLLLQRAVRYAIERKKVEQALRTSESFYQSLVEHLPQNILRKDVGGRFTFANQKFCAELGLPLSEITGKTDYDFFPPELAAKYQEDDRQVMNSGRIHETIEEHTPPGGGRVFVQVVKTAIYDEVGEIIGTQTIFWDVTEKTLASDRLKKAHAELAANKDELLKTLADLQRSHNELKETQLQLIELEKMQTIGQLAAGVAHEVKNPLAILRMGLEYLDNATAGANPNTRQVLKDMADAVHRADTIIMGMLDFSAQRTLAQQEFDLNVLVTDSLSLIRHELHSGKQTARIQLEPCLPKASGDPNKLKQVLINLLTNSCHAMEAGGELYVRTFVRERSREFRSGAEGTRDTAIYQIGGTDLVCTIEDTGPGIPPEALRRVFDPFYTTKPTGKGTGLGLSVARKILELHHGSLTLENRAPHGITATIVLPTKLK